MENDTDVTIVSDPDVTIKADLDVAPGSHPGTLLDRELSPDEASEQIEKILGDPARKGPRDQTLVDKETAELAKLQALAHPGLVQNDPFAETELRIDGNNAYTSPVPEDREWTADEGRAEIERRFGPDWQDRVRAAAETAIALDPALYEHMENHAAVGANDPDLIEHLHELSERNKQVPIVAALQDIVKEGLTPEQAKSRRFERMGDPAFRDRYDRGDPSAVAELEALTHWHLPPRPFRRLMARVERQR